MKKAIGALTIIGALTTTTVALAQEPKQVAQTTVAPGAAPPPLPAAPLAQSTPPASTPQPTEGTAPTGACPQTTATTTITAGEAMAAPLSPSPPPTGETVTLKQSIRPHRPLLYTGGIMLLSSYAATAALTAMRDVRDQSGEHSLYIPVAGPWMHLMNSKESPFNTWLIASSGLLQGAGIVLGALSLIIPERIPAATIQAAGVKMNVTATTSGSGSAGIGAVGQF
jgi:hypothetical protein